MTFSQRACTLRILRGLAERMRKSADNISPIRDDGSGGDAHPAPDIRAWARTIEMAAETLSATEKD